MTLRRVLLTLLILVVVIASIPFCCIGAGAGYLYSLTLYCDYRTYRAERWLKSTFEDVIEVAEDEQIEGSPPEVEVGGGSTIYILGEANQVFGTDRSYEDVLKSYSDWLLDHGWERDETYDRDDDFIYRVVDGAEYFYLSGDSGKTLTLSPWEPENGSIDYATTYIVVLKLTAAPDSCSF
jgi:hypothetical protein